MYIRGLNFGVKNGVAITETNGHTDSADETSLQSEKPRPDTSAPSSESSEFSMHTEF